jgi:hypothetical protein
MEKQFDRGAADASGSPRNQNPAIGYSRPQNFMMRLNVLGKKRGCPARRQSAELGIKKQGRRVRQTAAREGFHGMSHSC